MSLATATPSGLGSSVACMTASALAGMSTRGRAEIQARARPAAEIPGPGGPSHSLRTEGSASSHGALDR